MVQDMAGTAVEGAKIHVEGNKKVVVTSSRGEYWRLLLPGKNYTLVNTQLINVIMIFTWSLLKIQNYGGP